MNFRGWALRVVLLALASAGLIALVSGCGVDDVVSKQDEIELGRQTAEHIQNEVGVCSDQYAAKTVAAVGHAVVVASGCSDYDFKFTVLDDETLNACACPGGFVFVNKGMVDACSEDELAAVIGHEVAHVVRRHSVNRLMQAYGLTLLLSVISGDDISDLEGIAAGLLQARFSREDEDEADRIGQRFAFLAGYSPLGMVQLHERLQERHGSLPSLLTWINSHPSPRHRISRARRNLVTLYAQHGDRRPREDAPQLVLLLESAHGSSDAGEANAIAKKLSETGLAQVRALDISLYGGVDCAQVARNLGCDGVLRISLSQQQAEENHFLRAAVALQPLGADTQGFSATVEGDTFADDRNVKVQTKAMDELCDDIVGELIWKLM
jgi:predicted Zn-dependent protease